MSLVFPSSHPIVLHQIASLRDARTRPPEFRRLVRTLAMLLAQDATLDLTTRPVEVPTPLGPSPARNLVDTIGIVPILRAGLGMAEGVLELDPRGRGLAHRPLSRRADAAARWSTTSKLPASPRMTIALVVDPMLATGGSAVHACEILKAAGVTRIKLIALIAAPEGIARHDRGDARRADPRRA